MAGIDVTARQLRLLLDSAMGDDPDMFVYYLTQFTREHESADLLTTARVQFMLHLQNELVHASPMMIMVYLRDCRVRQRCLQSIPPNIDDNFLFVYSAADEQLMTATRRSDVAAVRSAIANGGSNYRTPGYLRDTPVHVAAATGNTSILEILLLHDSRSVDQLSLASHHRSPLHLAVLGGHTDAAALLLRHHAASDILDSTKRTPLHLAFEVLLPQDHHFFNTISYQLRKIDPGPLVSSIKVLPPLFLLLLAAKADINAAGLDDGLTCLHWACMNGLRNVALQLLALDADKDAVSGGGFAPIHCATLALQHTIVRDLLTRGARVDGYATGLGSPFCIAEAATPHPSGKRPMVFAYRKQKCLEVLGLCQSIARVMPEYALEMVQDGTWCDELCSMDFCIEYLRQDTRLALAAWARSCLLDEAATYSALYVGRGLNHGGVEVLLRGVTCAVAPQASCCSIRVRLLRFLISPSDTRRLAADILAYD